MHLHHPIQTKFLYLMALKKNKVTAFLAPLPFDEWRTPVIFVLYMKIRVLKEKNKGYFCYILRQEENL